MGVVERYLRLLTEVMGRCRRIIVVRSRHLEMDNGLNNGQLRPNNLDIGHLSANRQG